MKKYCANHLAYSASVYLKGKTWVSNWRFNGLFSIEEENVDFVGRFLGYPDDYVGAHSFAESYKDVLIFFPQKSHIVDFYNVSEDRFWSAYIGPWEKYSYKSIIGILRVEDGFWLFPRYGELPIVKMAFNGEIIEVIEIGSQKKLGINSNNKMFALSVSTLPSGDVYVPVYNTNNILHINLKTKKEHIIHFDGNYSFCAIFKQEEKYWLSSKDNIIVLDSEFNILKKYDNVIETTNILDKPAEVAQIVLFNNDIWVIPVWYGAIGKINLDEELCNKLDLLSNRCEIIEDRIKTWRTFKTARVENNTLVINPIGLDCQIEITGEIVSYKKLMISDNCIPAIALDKYKVIDNNQEKGRENIGKRVFEQCL